MDSLDARFALLDAMSPAEIISFAAALTAAVDDTTWELALAVSRAVLADSPKTIEGGA